MKHLLKNTNGYKVYIEKTGPEEYSGKYCLKILTQQEESKKPGEFRTQFTVFLDPSDIENLKNIINSF